jgi:ATP-dependent Clp protease protease subunit
VTTAPGQGPVDDGPLDDPRDRGVALDARLHAALLGQRIVLVGGPLTTETVTRAAAELMLLDADAVEPVRLVLSSPGGDLDAALALAGTVSLVRGLVEATAHGRVGGAALAPYAAAGRRLAMRHCVLELTEPRTELSGRASEVAAAVASRLDQLTQLHELVAAATGRAVEEVAADLRAGRVLPAEEAVGYGLVDAIVGA